MSLFGWGFKKEINDSIVEILNECVLKTTASYGQLLVDNGTSVIEVRGAKYKVIVEKLALEDEGQG